MNGDHDKLLNPSESLARQTLRQFLKNRLAVASAIFLLFMVLGALCAPVIAPKHYAEEDIFATYLPPGDEFILGSDFLGRDVLSRVLYGARVSLAVAFIAALMSFLIGLSYGMIAGYLGGKMDEWMMRFVDLVYALPSLVLIILIMVYFRSGDPNELTGLRAALYHTDAALGGLLTIFLGIALTSWITMARIARGEVLALKQRAFIENAVAQGIRRRRIIRKHLLPNILGPCLVAESLAIPDYILIEAFLSFIGIGVNPPMPSWGAMIAEATEALRSYPHLLFAPVTAMVLTVLAFNFVGDGLRDALDPKLATS
jgi:oligopeptide transport system permease protein